MAKLFRSEMAPRRSVRTPSRFTAATATPAASVERIYRDVRVSQIYEDLADIQRLVIGHHRGCRKHGCDTAPEATPDDFSRRAEGFLPGWFGMRVTAITPGRLEDGTARSSGRCWRRTVSCMRLPWWPGGYCSRVRHHRHLPEGSGNFTTIEQDQLLLDASGRARYAAWPRSSRPDAIRGVLGCGSLRRRQSSSALFRCADDPVAQGHHLRDDHVSDTQVQIPTRVHFDFIKPYGYLAAERIDELAAKYGRR